MAASTNINNMKQSIGINTIKEKNMPIAAKNKATRNKEGKQCTALSESGYLVKRIILAIPEL